MIKNIKNTLPKSSLPRGDLFFGLTLIETLIYIALLGVIIGSFIEVTFIIMESQRRVDERAVVLDEVSFLLKKIEHYMRDASEIISPSIGEVKPFFQGKMGNESFKIEYSQIDRKLNIAHDSGPPITLNTDKMALDDVSFSRSVNLLAASLSISGKSYEIKTLIYK